MGISEMPETRGTIFTRRQIVEGMGIEDQWLSNMTKLGVFETVIPNVGRGRERRYPVSEIWVIRVVARIVRRSSQQPTSFLKKIASATRAVAVHLGSPGEEINPAYLTLDYQLDGTVSATVRRSTDYTTDSVPWSQLRLVEDDTEIINLFNLGKLYPMPSPRR